jgi:hypothetical protein
MIVHVDYIITVDTSTTILYNRSLVIKVNGGAPGPHGSQGRGFESMEVLFKALFAEIGVLHRPKFRLTSQRGYLSGTLQLTRGI